MIYCDSYCSPLNAYIFIFHHCILKHELFSSTAGRKKKITEKSNGQLLAVRIFTNRYLLIKVLIESDIPAGEPESWC